MTGSIILKSCYLHRPQVTKNSKKFNNNNINYENNFTNIKCLLPLHSPRLGRTAWNVPRLHYASPRRNLLALQGNQCQIGFHLASSISPIIAFDVRLCQYVKELTSL